MDLLLSLEEAEALHVALEESLQGGLTRPELERIYRLLEWRILATRGGTGLTAHLSDLARNASTLEEYEIARDEYLGPILGGLERGENRDP